MKFGIIILCRYSSSRLPGKILRTINGKTILSIIVDQLKVNFNYNQIIVATSNHVSDQKIINYCIENEINYFIGELHNVSKRFLDCAKNFNLDYAVRINGDNVFIDIHSLSSMIKIAENHNYDLVSNVPFRTFPYGMSIEIINTSFYESVIPFFSKENKEHVSNWLYDNPKLVKSFTFKNNEFINLKGIKLAVDTEKDLKKCQLIYNKIGFDEPVNLMKLSNLLNDRILLDTILNI